MRKGNRPLLLNLAIAAAVCLLLTATVYAAQDGSDTAGNISLWSTIVSGGVIGIVILIVSLVGAALVIENFMTLGRERLMPADLAEGLEKEINQGNDDQALELCREDDSFLAKVIGAGLEHRESSFGFFDMQNAMQEVSERYISGLYRKVEYLSFIAAVSPILGLLGTVTGMIRAFNQIAVTEGAARPSQLAGGISEALVTTCMGLIVAIPAMFFVTYFRSRIESSVAEAETLVERLMGKFKRPVS